MGEASLLMNESPRGSKVNAAPSLLQYCNAVKRISIRTIQNDREACFNRLQSTIYHQAAGTRASRGQLFG